MGVAPKARRVTATIALAVSIGLGGSFLAACSNSGDTVAAAAVDTEAAVLADSLAASETLLKSSEAVIVSSAGKAEQRRAAAIAVATNLPMLVVGTAEEGAPLEKVEAEIERLGAKKVLTVGAVDLSSSEDRTVIVDPGTEEGIEELIDVNFDTIERREPTSQMSKAITEMTADKPTLVDLPNAGSNPSQQDVDRANGGEDKSDEADRSIPVAKPGDNDDVVAFSVPGTDLASIATARAAGMAVEWLPAGDARATSGSIEAAREEKSLVALGPGFGSADKFAKSVDLARDDSIQELPGGGTLLFPGRHIVATYGHPGEPLLGLMGEEDAEGAVATAQEYVKQYQDLTDDKVIPAFEIIASVAQGDPGPRGDYSAAAPIETLEPYVDAMTEAGGYVIIDLQPGSADFLEQAKYYEELLKRPNVGLALDPEWKLYDGQIPNQVVGHVKAEEINEVADWLAKLTADNNLPQKMLMLHQFQLQMIRDRETLDLSHPELAFVLHADGHGTAEQKFETWNVLLQDLQPEIFVAWKNFLDEDEPQMFTPEQTMDIEPRPWVVTYQ